MVEYIAPKDWQRSSIFSLANWKNGLAFKNIDFSEAGRPIIKIAELKAGVTSQTTRTMADYDPSVSVGLGDMLFSWSGNPDTSIDVFRWKGEDGWLNQHIFKVTPSDGVSADFLFFLLKWLKPKFAEIARNKQTTGLGHVTIQDLKQTFVGVPDAKEQAGIIGVIGPIQDKIELNRRMNETLEAMARAIFKDWFVDFGPTRAKAAGRAPYLGPELWDLFPDALDSEGNPVGWTLAPLSVLAEVNPESWSKKNTPDEIEYVDLANTKWGSIDVTQRFHWRDAPIRAKRILRPGDTIIGLVRPSNGSYAFIGVSGLTGSTGFAVLRPREPQDTEIVFLSATAPQNIERLAHLADGAAYPAVRPEAVEATEVAIASNALTRGFSALVAPIVDRMESNKIENQTLAQTRDLLLPKLMSGEMRLPYVERVVKAVA